ncbi:MAG: SDR family oxidoreductase [bacterium]
MKLENKIVLITGASSGIGRSTAVAFAKEGCSVLINYKTDTKSAEDVLEECNHYSKENMLVQADITMENDIVEMFKKIKEKNSRLDVLVNNAGIFDEGDSPTNIEVFEKIYKNNFLGCIMVTKYALGLLKEGKIVNVSSIHGRLGHGSPESIAYSTFKTALDSYTKNLAKSLAPQILVNGIAPGRVATPMWDSPNEKEQIELGQVHLIKRMIQPEEIADSILFLAKNDAMCGEVLTIDGGMSLVTLG